MEEMRLQIHSFEELATLDETQLKQIKERLLWAIEEKQRNKFRLVGEILFYQNMLKSTD
jgi:hypothetical protein